MGIALQGLHSAPHRAATDAEKTAQTRGLIRKFARQAGKDYLSFPALSLRRWRRTLTANVVANLLRNVWAYLVICCGHFPDGAEKFTPANPTDGKFANQEINGIRILITNRNSMQPSRVGAALLWAIAKTSPNDLKLNDRAFDLRFGAPRIREALMRGEDPDAVIDREYREAYAFREKTRQYLLYQ